MDTHSQLCIYVGNEMVVDLHGCPTESRFDADSLLSVWSSGKSVAAILLGIINDKGHLSYDDTVAKHWPEFAKNGKHFLTIADIMRHEGGLNKLHKSVEIPWIKSQMIK